ncbi:transitional endoplasmic reticulum ATPase-like [Heracleum sosnowskyi]|uniref:Transitional endoplasmic reticulum ATPase-like n=1 Tax=Heracleum sosnowskyi TaxID=360622 RepID=A0AAD8I9Y4_9APIA|nr:transitional endoplasmic reticulum ATPase-like [Heracleum sosnowskyi]
MDQNQKNLYLSAIGVGIGVGIGLASGQAVSKWTGGSDSSAITPPIMEQEMLNLIVDGRDSKVTFDDFPYYLSSNPNSSDYPTIILLTSAGFVYLKNYNFSKHTRNLAPASRTILLSGPAELYQQMLAKALAHYFQAKLLSLDITDFSLKIQGKYGAGNKQNITYFTGFTRSISETTLARMSGLFGSLAALQPREDQSKGTLRRQRSIDAGLSQSEGTPPMLRRNSSASANLNNIMSSSTYSKPAPLKRTSSLSLDEKLFLQTLYKVLISISKTNPIILYLRDVDKLLCRSQRMYVLFQKMLKKLSGSVMILGSHISDPGDDYSKVDERLTSVFSYTIEIKAPEDEYQHVSWKSQLEEDMKMIQYQDNRNHITEVLAANDLDCDDLGSICLADTMIISNYIEEIVVSAISYHLMNTKDPDYRNGKLVISSERSVHYSIT